MTRLTSRSRLAAAVSPIAFAMALCAGSGTAWAQDTTTADPNAPAATSTEATPSEDQTDEVTPPEGQIIVTGFRASLQSAINTKKRADQIVESVSSEDIGKLPDASIGEAIARLPGITSQVLNGRANVVSIRGFGPDYSTTL